MNVDIQLFSILRGCLPPDAKGGKATITLADDATVVDLVAHLGIHSRLGYEAAEIVTRAGWQVMVNGRDERDVGRVLRDGDRVVILPWIFGG